ncbi:helix-turn-helix domain-containing protein [Desulfovirgula thermocuniculi]
MRKKIGISRSFATQIINSTRYPSLRIAQKISDFFAIPINELFDIK